jgi:hypothetical protein
LFSKFSSSFPVLYRCELVNVFVLVFVAKLTRQPLDLIEKNVTARIAKADAYLLSDSQRPAGQFNCRLGLLTINAAGIR